MRMMKTTAAMVMVSIAMACLARDSAPFPLDTSTPPEIDSVPVSWDAAWIGGDTNATVVIADNGTEVKRATGTGESLHALSSAGLHELTYTTYIGGVAQKKVYRAWFNYMAVRSVTAKQRYPWNGMMDIDCKVTGFSGTPGRVYFAMTAEFQDSGISRNVSHFWVVRDGTNSTDRAVHVDGEYRLVWDARADLGAAVHSNMIVRVILDPHDKVQLWKDGPYWADTNIGAKEPWDYGYYFWWGDTIGYTRKDDRWAASDGSSDYFSFDYGNTPTRYKSTATLKNDRWITASGVLNLSHDAARVHWGGSWRMPTKKELSDLVSNCSWSWTTLNGVKGYIVRGKGDYASNSIFLPCAGYGRETSLNAAGSGGHYLSSVSYSDGYYFGDYAWNLSFVSSGHNTTPHAPRDDGFSVRPVQGGTQ